MVNATYTYENRLTTADPKFTPNITSGEGHMTL